MITLVKARNYRCLRSVIAPLRAFQILVGPNGSGKSAFMDVLGFLRDLVSKNLSAAVEDRTKPIGDFRDLVWGREESGFGLSVEAEIPEGQRLPSDVHSFSHLRYDVSVRAEPERDAPREGSRSGARSQHVSVRAEPERDAPLIDTETVALVDRIHGETLTVAAQMRTHAQFFREDGTQHPYQPEIDRKTSVLSHPPPEPTGFPASIITWFTTFLREGIVNVSLSTEDLHQPSTVEAEKASKLTGANLARSVFDLQEKQSESFEAWIRHLRTALPDLESVFTKVREESRLRYLVVRDHNGVELPSWTISDGTLCLLALTILAYLPEPNVVYLIEEPENAVHPTAVDTIYQSLSSLYDGQVLMASHSPILLGLAKKEQLLCFSRTPQGTQIVPGNEHPVLQEWKGEVNLSDLFAAGVLG